MATNPLEQFEVKTLIPIEIAGLDVSFTNASLWMVLSILAATALMTLTTKRKAIIPGRWQNMGEVLYEFVSNMLRDAAGPESRKYFPFIFSIFMIVLMGNLLGLIPYSFTTTSQIIVTATLAILVITFVTIVGFVRHGLKFLKLFAPSGVPLVLLPLMIPIEIISYLSRPFSLSVRLFANMMAGHTMMKVFALLSVQAGLVIGFGPLAINVALTLFEVLIAILQAYIFAILSSIYLRDAIELH